jgi:hypothetical protein
LKEKLSFDREPDIGFEAIRIKKLVHIVFSLRLKSDTKKGA